MSNSNITTTTEAASVTGRDGYIVAKALVYAIAHIQSLPEERQEYGDMLDMCDLVYKSGLPQSLIDMIVHDVERHVRQEVNLYPLEGMDKERSAMRARIDAMKAALAEAIRRFNEGEEEAA
ncbi:hypothetical protein [Paracoccus sp. MKU1]|uniref:hypothetical protein n=1 Tax=Paracoccus sp. MKU1 TaxID=1745182 RepID=UPI0007190BD3|nr:hypothetical protein [Paracoccus sp. MKU1]KRW96245.1 hypothetical protein AQY21_10195 [Paracoccus sp. MKU1]